MHAWHVLLGALVVACAAACGGGEAEPMVGGECEQGDVSCDGQRVLRCQSGTYLEAELCGDADVCEEGTGCVELCDPGSIAVCSGPAVYTCNSDGTRGELRETCPNGPCEDGACTVDDPRWQAFVAARGEHLEALSVPILACVARIDTTHPAFHGCVDWHSAVHGTWALLALTRLTGDARFKTAAEVNLRPRLLAEELADVRAGIIDVELPYGFAWFLRLARERAVAGDTDLEALAVEIADQLEARITSMSAAEVREALLQPDYDNLSWAVLNLWQWAQWKLDAARAERLVVFTRTNLLVADAACPLEADQTQTDFFPPCLQRARTVIAVLPRDEVLEWLSSFAPTPIALTPVGEPVTDHQAGQTFARAFGLWELWRISGDLGWLHLYLDHVEGWVAKPEYWADDYQSYAHWVAQLGVYAIDLSAP